MREMMEIYMVLLFQTLFHRLNRLSDVLFKKKKKNREV